MSRLWGQGLHRFGAPSLWVETVLQVDANTRALNLRHLASSQIAGIYMFHNHTTDVVAEAGAAAQFTSKLASRLEDRRSTYLVNPTRLTAGTPYLECVCPHCT